MHPLITVIVPVYKTEKFVIECVNSITNQTYTNYELILIDDGSPDNAGKICDDFSKQDARITVIHQENRGLSAARNAGIEKSTGEFITFIDSDDFVEPNYLEVLLEMAEKHHLDISQVGSTTSEKMCSANSDRYGVKIFSAKKDAVVSLMDFRAAEFRMNVLAWGKLYRKSIVGEIRFPEGKLYEDTATTYKFIMAANGCVCSNIPLYHYRRHEGSITQRMFPLETMDMYYLNLQRAEEFLKAFPNCERIAELSIYNACCRALLKMYGHKHTYKDEWNLLASGIKVRRNLALKTRRLPKILYILAVLSYFPHGLEFGVWMYHVKKGILKI